ncbi:MAG TPA: erythromycin esterase family protein, partial [Gemmatimonadaceae bacterium]|nr:erythromycin esterase family protein [Gemmatimonadaceae bacterium]
MSALDDRELTRAIRDAAHPLRGAPSDFDPLLALIGDARVVLLGEATHGTHEFYELRARITKRLLVERGFGAVVIEGDWPDAYRVNRYVRDCSADSEAIESLAGFRRFPQWMWRNADVLDFVGWLRRHNDRKGERQRAGFYGLDLYSLHASIAAVLRWLAVVDPGAAARARERYACFELFGPDPRDYGRLTSLGIAPPCEQEVVSQLVELRQETGRLLAHADTRAGDDLFFAQQNARVVLNAERYYRAMFGDYVRSWNLRDQHMTETLAALLAHLCTNMARSRVVVWAHNAHIGDARATEMGTRGEVTLGQLAREQLGANVVSVGFTTYTGSVTAARDWEEPAEHVAVRPALRES